MKALLILGAVLLTAVSYGQTYVEGYTRSDGTYVRSHYRSDSDSSFDNNWSTYGNYNPYTGAKGYRRRRGY